MSHKFLSLVSLMHNMHRFNTQELIQITEMFGSLCIHTDSSSCSTHRITGSSGAKAELTETTKRTPAVQDVDMEFGRLGS